MDATCPANKRMHTNLNHRRTLSYKFVHKKGRREANLFKPLQPKFDLITMRVNHLMINDLLLFFLLASLMLSPMCLVIKAQSTNANIPSSCTSTIGDPQYSESKCQQDLYDSINYTVVSYTDRFANQFAFCVSDP